MGLNLSSISSLANLNPTALATKAAIYVAAVSLVFVSGYVTGCVHNQHKVDAGNLKASEDARVLEKTDGKQGNTAAAEVRQKENQILAAGKQAASEVSQKPVYVIRWKSYPQACPVGDKNPSAESGNEKSAAASASVDFSAHAMRLYDLSISGGSTGVQSGTYEESRTIPLDEGLQNIIIPNNTSCAAIANQLNSLIDRIKEKQKLFGHKE